MRQEYAVLKVISVSYHIKSLFLTHAMTPVEVDRGSPPPGNQGPRLMKAPPLMEPHHLEGMASVGKRVWVWRTVHGLPTTSDWKWRTSLLLTFHWPGLVIWPPLIAGEELHAHKWSLQGMFLSPPQDLMLLNVIFLFYEILFSLFEDASHNFWRKERSGPMS